MKSYVKKCVLLGCTIGILMSSIITATAMTTSLDGHLYTKNPLWSAPKGYASTAGYKKITAKCTVSKSGYSTKSVSTSDNAGTAGGYIETDWIYGPTYKSSGTKFTSKHTGYDYFGTYYTKTASYKY